MKLYLDAGHGGKDPGALGNGLIEKELTLDIALRIRTILLNNYENIEILMSRTSDITKSLIQRTNEANSWGADFYLSIHINAASTPAEKGYEGYIHNSVPDKSKTKRYQATIHEEVMKRNKLNNRGQKKANFHVLRESAMPAFLSENGFISSPRDAALMKQPAWRQHVALGHVGGIIKAFKLKRKSKKGNFATILYKVIAGSFNNRLNAEERVVYLRTKKLESIIVPAVISGRTMFRVQAGAFASKKNAEDTLKKVINAGITDAFLDAESNPGVKPTPKPLPEKPKPTPSPTPAPDNPATVIIKGPTYLSPEQMNLFVKSINPNAPELGNYYLKFGEYYGIRGDIALAQAIKETNYFRFTGTVKAEQNNFAGLGSTGPSQSGASFKSPEEGVLAHIQHLYAYATTEPMANKYPLVDPRFRYVNRGSAPIWTALNGKWAVPGTNYGESILEIYERMVNFGKKIMNNVISSFKK